MPYFISVNSDTVHGWKEFTGAAVKLIDIHRELLDSYVLDFFTEDLWSQINPKWASVLNRLTPADLASFLCCDEAVSQNSVWPLSLLSFRAAAFTYSLPRKSVLSLKKLTAYLNTQRPVEAASLVPSSCARTLHGHDTKQRVQDKLDQITSTRTLVAADTEKGSSDLLPQNQDHSTFCHLRSTKNCKEALSFLQKGVVDKVPNEKKHTSKICKNVRDPPCGDVLQTVCLDAYETIEKVCTVTSPLQQVEVNWGDSDSELSAAAGQHKLLQHVFRRHLKPKKQHEVARLALVTGQVCCWAGLSVAVDVGAGQGHLSRLLAYGHNIRVVCLEAEDEFIAGARKFDKQLEAAVEKMKRCQTSLPPLPPAPHHTVCHLQPDTSPEIFTKVVSGAWGSEEAFDGCGLVGLHTCGDLGPTILRLFTNTPSCQALVSVGCCYMKLTAAESDGAAYPGYPMSQYLQCLPGHTLSYAAREVACHAIEMYASRLKEGADNLKVHCYRACLEEVIMKYWPHHHHAGLRSVNKAHLMDFPMYAITAVGKLQDVTLPEDDLTSDQMKQKLSRWMQVVVYYSLRLLLAPVVETVILLDRLIFLFENSVDGLLFPAFDPQLSPRNHVLVAVKPNKKE